MKGGEFMNPTDPNQGGGMPADPNAGQPAPTSEPQVPETPVSETPAPEAPVETPQPEPAQPGMGGDQDGSASQGGQNPAGGAPVV